MRWWLNAGFEDYTAVAAGGNSVYTIWDKERGPGYGCFTRLRADVWGPTVTFYACALSFDQTQNAKSHQRHLDAHTYQKQTFWRTKKREKSVR